LGGSGFEYRIECCIVSPQELCDQVEITALRIGHHAVGQCRHGKIVKIVCMGGVQLRR